MIGAMTDITNRKQTEEKFRKSKRRIELQNIQLKKLDRIKSDFLNVTSHELRTPMASIKGYAQMLLKQSLGKISEEQKRGLEVVLRNTDRLDHLVQDILDISQLQSGTMKFIPEKIDVRTMIKETIETMQSSANLKDIKINVEVEENTSELFIDQRRVRQVIMNIVNNAIKFSPYDSIINTRVKKEDDDILFEFQDFGKGIPKDKHKKIFETFYQVDSGMDRKHGGNIWVESETGKGSTFRFKLPIQPVEDIEETFKELDIFGLDLEK